MGNGDSFARQMRLRRLYRQDDGGLLVVPLDHAVAAGPLGDGGALDGLLATLADAGTDAVVLHKGAARRVRPERFHDMALIVHLNAGTNLAADPDARYPVATVEEAVRLGADAVSVQVNLASATEDRQIAHLGEVAAACDRWGMPLLAMMYVRGPAVPDGRAPHLVAHAVAVAVELGADLVKTALPTSSPAIARITASCPVPVLAAGGPDARIEDLATAVRSGAGGIAAGRVVFTAGDPGSVARGLSALVHGRVPVRAR